MSLEEDIKKEYNKIQIKNGKVVASMAIELLGVLQEASPVGQYPAGSGRVGGELRRSWQSPVQLGRFSWRVSNVAPHAVIIDGGRREAVVNGTARMIGSEQLPKGYDPIIKEFEKKLQQAVNKV